MEAARGPRQLPTSLTLPLCQPKPRTHTQSRGSEGPSGKGGDQVQKNVSVSSAWDPSPTQAQQSQQKQKHNKLQTTNTYTHKKPYTGTATGQRSPEAPALYGCTKTSPGTDNTTAPARRKREGQRSKSLSVQLQKISKRTASGRLAAWLFFFPFSFF